MKVDRMLSIVLVLLRRRRVQAQELAQLFEVSPRTILRDIEAINLAGIPIITYQGSGGGIGIAEGFRLERALLSEDDMAALLTAMRSVGATLPDNRMAVLAEKLRGAHSEPHFAAAEAKSRQLFIDLTPWGGDALLDRVRALREAIADHREVRFDYIDSRGQRSQRVVQGYAVVLKGQNWYLYAWCPLRQDYRFFKLHRMTAMQVLDSQFQPRDVALDELPWGRGSEPEVIELVLRVDPDMESTVIEWFGESAIERREDCLIVRAQWPENQWLYSFLLGFGAALTVLEPPHVREWVAEQARRTWLNYAVSKADDAIATPRKMDTLQTACEAGLHALEPRETPPFTLREATLEDAPALAAMNHTLIVDEGSDNPMTQEQLLERMAGFLQGEYRVVIIEVNGEDAGYCLFRPQQDGVYVRHYMIKPQHRMLGLGKAAFGAIKTAYLDHYGAVTLDVLHGNRGGMAFWHSVGFTPYVQQMRFTQRSL